MSCATQCSRTQQKISNALVRNSKADYTENYKRIKKDLWLTMLLAIASVGENLAENRLQQHEASSIRSLKLATHKALPINTQIERGNHQAHQTRNFDVIENVKKRVRILA